VELGGVVGKQVAEIVQILTRIRALGRLAGHRRVNLQVIAAQLSARTRVLSHGVCLHHLHC